MKGYSEKGLASNAWITEEDGKLVLEMVGVVWF